MHFIPIAAGIWLPLRIIKIEEKIVGFFFRLAGFFPRNPLLTSTWPVRKQKSCAAKYQMGRTKKKRGRETIVVGGVAASRTSLG